MNQTENIMTTDLGTLIKSGAIIIDVRSREEFSGGHVPGSINMPLQEIPSRLNEIKAFQPPVVLCCASGNRSGQAEYYLREQGLKNVRNGGSWFDVNYYKSNS